MKLKKLLIAAFAAMVSLGVNAQQTPEDGGVYYLYNTANGKFLTRGNNWGTQAVTNDFGSPWKVYIADGKYTLRMYDIVTAEGNTNRALGTNGFSDNNDANQHVKWTLTGDANAYKLSYDDGGTAKYLCSPNNYGDNVIYTDANFNTNWQFLNVSEYNAVLAAKKSAQETAIATTAGIDLGGSTLTAVVEDATNWRRNDLSSSVPFPSNSSWTRTAVPNRGGNANQGTYGIERYEGGGTESYTVTGLAKGIYKVGVKAMYRSASNAACSTVGEAGYVNSSAYFSANGNLVQIKDWYSSRTSATVPNSTGEFVNIANNGGYYSEVYTYVGDDGNLELKAVSESFWGGSWFLFNGVTLTYYSNSVSDEDINALIETIPTRVSVAQATAMNNAKTTLQSEKTIANYNALAAAITAAQTSVNEYAIIDAGIVPTNNTAGWAISTTNGALACNTWSTEGNNDGSGMTTPFIQDWVASGTALAGGNAGGKLYYTFTDLTPGETYVVTARVRVFNESATGVTGATYFVGANSKSLNEVFSSPCVGDFASKGRFAVLSCAGTVDSNGQLQFGIELANDSPINWMSIKDVTIAAGTGDVPESIALNENTLSLTTGSTANLTATITPATADDKTILWTSSDDAVATVSGGYVVAVAPGTATITANAYAGTNVNATCTVTVADAAAPAFYSTEIADGTDYYIMNAATGQFLGGANDWGTRAGLIEHGIPFGATEVSDGVYTLDSYTYNSETEHYVGVNTNGDLYVDHASANVYITSLGNDKFSISTEDGSAYVTASVASTVVTNKAENTDNTFAQWYFISKSDRDKMLAAATAGSPADATYYVKQANISRNRSAGGYNVDAWSQYNVGGNQDNANFAAQVYNAAVDNYQTIENIPNGTYIVSVQAFTSGTDVKFYANDQKVDVKANDSGVGSCSGAAALFKQGRYPNTVTVTVTDRTLKIGFEGDCSGSKWLCYDDVTLYMTSYAPATGIAAEDVELQIGQTAEIGAATVPASASFNALTYKSADENIATVDANGVVTGIAVGNTTITITAEMENVSKTINVTVKLVTPTAFALSETEVSLDKDNTSATLTIVPTPVGANDAATWKSSDETVATVANGVITAVSSGTATITATSVIDTEVSAQATVTVDFPESTVPASYYVNDGATRTVYTTGENLIKNGSFEYPNPLYGWKTIGYTQDAVEGNATVNATGGFNDGAFITTAGGAASSDKTLRRSFAVEVGKTYYFAVSTSGKAPASNNFQYNALFKMSNATTEAGTIKQFEWPQGASTSSSEWSTTEVIFTAETPYVGVRMGWNSETSFDNFVLAEVSSTTEGNVQYALDAIPTANIGNEVFQYSQAEINATGASALVQGTATVEEVQAAYDKLQALTVKEPAAGQLFNVILTYNGYQYDNKAITFIAGGGNASAGNYTIQYKEVANKNLAQAFTFTKVSGNNYKMSQIDAAGVARYVSTGVPYGGNTAQIRTTTDASKALVVTVIPTATEGVYNLRNTEANNYIGSQDDGVYTVNSHIDFKLIETSKASIAINTTAAGWGTTILPFAVAELPTGVKAYTCAATSGNTLTLVEVNALEANKPYIIEGAWDETLTGDAQGTALTYTEGLLTGTYTEINAPNGSHVLQNQGGKVGFYLVDTNEATPKVPANRAYLDLNNGNEVKAFYLGGGEDAIKSVFEGVAAGEVYDLSGRKVSKLQHGVNIVNGKKVMVK